jgi:hypothetical protein
MKSILNIYRRFNAIPEDVTDAKVFSHLFVFTLFFFTLGFTVSQVIIFLVGK